MQTMIQLNTSISECKITLTGSKEIKDIAQGVPEGDG